MKVKKLLVSVLIAGTFLASLDADAQKRKGKKYPGRFGRKANTEKPFTIGFVGGANILNYTVPNAKMKIGFHIGGIAEYKFHKMFGASAELLYSMQGFKSQETSAQPIEIDGVDFFSTKIFDINSTINCLNIPIMFKFYPVSGLFIEAGPHLGFNLSYSVTQSGTITIPAIPPATEGSTTNIPETTTKVDRLSLE